MKPKFPYVSLAVVVVLGLMLASCAPPAPQVIEKVVTQVVKEEVKVIETQVVEKPVEKVVEKIVEKTVLQEAYTTPHPILSELKVRQAIAYCTDRDSMISASYPYVEDKNALRMDSFLSKDHWAYAGPYKDYPYDPAKGKALLEELGWKQQGDYRVNAKGETLALKFVATQAQLRQNYAAIMEQNWKDCGILMVRQHVPAAWLYGDTTGLARRDFETVGFAWGPQSMASGRTLYACDQIPLPSNNWVGQNYMGWCNKEASDAISLATNSLDLKVRKEAYDTVQNLFAEDLPSLPLFNRAEAEAWSLNLDGLKLDPIEYTTASAADWKLKDGSDTMVLALTQEPATMFSLAQSAAVQRQVAQLGIGIVNTIYGYQVQPVIQDGLSTLDSGLAKLNSVDVKAGDMVYDTSGKATKLDKGIKVRTADDQVVEYDGSSPLKMPQLVVTYKLKPYTWSDGTAGSIEDVKLAFKVNCDKQSGAYSYVTCDTIDNVEYGQDSQYTVTFLPGVLDPNYAAAPFSTDLSSVLGALYPSHQVLKDGRKLAEVPPGEWSTLPEIAEKPLSYGPYVIEEWVKGQSIKLKANPYYQPAPNIKNIVVIFISDTNQAVAQLLSGDVDYLERVTLAGGPETESVMRAAKQGEVNAQIVPSGTWEHLDFNLYTK